jgi:hypothetical protein
MQQEGVSWLTTGQHRRWKWFSRVGCFLHLCISEGSLHIGKDIKARFVLHKMTVEKEFGGSSHHRTQSFSLTKYDIAERVRKDLVRRCLDDMLVVVVR